MTPQNCPGLLVAASTRTTGRVVGDSFKAKVTVAALDQSETVSVTMTRI